MNAPIISVKYFHKKSFKTVDMNSLINMLMDNYGENICITISPMTEFEREKSSEVVEGGIIAITNRVMIFEKKENGNLVRQKQMENQVHLESP